MNKNCKEYQVKLQIIKCSSEKHSEHCLKAQELKEKYPSAKEILWNSEKQIWSINFDYLGKKPSKVKEKTPEPEEKPVDLEENDDN